MLNNLNTSASGGLQAGPYVGPLGSEIQPGGDFDPWLLKHINPAFPDRRYALGVEVPSAGELFLDRLSNGYFDAPPGAYTGWKEIEEYDPGVGLADTKVGTYTLTVEGDVPGATVPAAPTGVEATASEGVVSVTGAPGGDGGAVVTSWEVLALTGQTASSESLPVEIEMPYGVAATFRLRAVNEIGPGAWSAPSNSVTLVEDLLPVDIDVSKIPGSRRVIFAGSIRVVNFEGQ